MGLPDRLVRRAVLMRVWDHFYKDSAFCETVSTHYVYLPYWLLLGCEETEQLS